MSGAQVPPRPGVDVLLVSVGATTGWRAAARELQAAFSLAGARAQIADAGSVPEVRTFMLTDLIQARAARRTAAAAIAEYRPRALVYCSITAACCGRRRGRSGSTRWPPRTVRAATACGSG